jgi:hypothetical protein
VENQAMTELTVRLDLSFGHRSLRLLMIAGTLFSAATEVASETVTLSTAYPSPSGVYSQLIATGNTNLARDGGQVGIGTSALTMTTDGVPNGELEVSGGMKVDGVGIYNSAGYQLLETDTNIATNWNQGAGTTFGNAMYQPLALASGGLAVGNGSNQGQGNIYAAGTLQAAGGGSNYILGKLGVGIAAPGGTLDVSGVLIGRTAQLYMLAP